MSGWLGQSTPLILLEWDDTSVNHVQRLVLIVSIFLVLTLATTVPIYVHADEKRHIATILWSPDGTKLAAADTSGGISIWNPATGQVLSSFQAHSETINSLSWNPDGSRLATASGADGVRIWDLMNGKLIAEVHADIYNNAFIQVAWNSDGSKLVNVTAESDGGFPLHFWSVQGDHFDPMPLTGNIAAYNIAWRPNSASLTVADYGGGIYILDDFSFDRFKQHAVFPYRWAIAWDHEGVELAAASEIEYVDGLPQLNGKIDIISADTGEVLTTLNNVSPSSHNGVASLAWDVDDVRLFADNFDGTVKIWDTSNGELLDVILLNREASRFSMSLSPFGGRLALVDAAADEIPTGQADGVDVFQTLADGAIQIIVPIPSLERLQTIADACHASAGIQGRLPTSDTSDQLESFISQVEALPPEEILPGCAADLVAVAQALRN